MTGRLRLVRGDESGMTLVEMLVASVISLAVFLAASTAAWVSTTAASRAVNQSGSLPPVLIAAQEAQQILSSAWNPVNGAPNITDDCASNQSGGAFSSGDGPFVEATSTDIQFCSLNLGSAKAYTYELHFSPRGCSAASCSLELDQWPPAGCSGAGCTTLTKWVVTGIAGDTGISPFSFDYYSSGALTPTAVLSQIQVVVLDLSAPATTSSASNAGQSGTRVRRDVVLCNTLGGMC